jgi:hypothetical protein
MIEFGRIPDLNPLQVGQILQLIEMQAQLQNLEDSLKTVRYIERVKTGLTFYEKEKLDLIRRSDLYRNDQLLPTEVVFLLKKYITLAEKPGGLNGFELSYRLALFQIIENHVNDGQSGFTPFDVETLRRVEQENNGFSYEQVFALEKMIKKKNKHLSPEDFALIDRFNDLQQLIGVGILLDTQKSQRLNQFLNEPSKAHTPHHTSPSHRQNPEPSPELNRQPIQRETHPPIFYDNDAALLNGSKDF